MMTNLKHIGLFVLTTGLLLTSVAFGQTDQKNSQTNIPTVPPCEECGGGGGGTAVIDIGTPQLEIINGTTLGFKCGLILSNIDTATTVFTWNWKVNGITRTFNAKASLVSQNWQSLDLSGLGLVQPNTYNFSLEVKAGAVTSGVDDNLTTFDYIYASPSLSVNASVSGTVSPTVTTATFDFSNQSGGSAFYKYSTNAGQSWSAAIPVTTPLILNNLTFGAYRVDFIGGWTASSSSPYNWMTTSSAEIKTWTILAPTLTLISPNGSEKLGKNHKTLITWNSNVLNSGTVNIVLYKQTSSSTVKTQGVSSKETSQALLANETPGGGNIFTSTVLMYNTTNDGSEIVTIPTSVQDEAIPIYIPDDDDYRIRIESSLGVQDNSDANVEIVTPNVYLSQTAPLEMDQTGTLNFSWGKNISAPVSLILSGTSSSTIRSSAVVLSGNESFALATVPKGQYKIIMTTAYDTIATSAAITVSESKISMLSPIGGTFVRGVNLPIRWQSNISGNVKIDLLENGNPVNGYVTASTIHDGAYDWSIPASLPAGVYQIRLTGLASGVIATSASFIIETGHINITSPAAGDITSDGANTYISFQTNMTGHVKMDLYCFSPVSNTYQPITPPVIASYDLPPVENCVTFIRPDIDELAFNPVAHRENTGAAIRSEIEGGGGGSGGGTGEYTPPPILLQSLCLRVNTPQSVTFSGTMLGLFVSAHPNDGLPVHWTLRRGSEVIQSGTVSLSSNQLAAGYTLNLAQEMIISAGYSLSVLISGSGYSFPSTSLKVEFSNNPYEYRTYMYTWKINNPNLINSTRYKIRISSVEDATIYTDSPDFTINDKYNAITAETILLDKIYTDSQIDTLSDQNLQRVKVYSDGMGRLRQTVAYKASTSKKDIISPVEYDRFGRVSKSYLPYVATNADGLFRKDWKTAQTAFYQNPPEGVAQTTTPFSVVKFENSSLGRAIEQGAPGEDWQPHPDDYDGHTIKVIERSNYENEVHRWHADGTDDGWYPAGEIMVRETRDENGTSSWTYTDKTSNTLLKKSIKDGEDVLTYYIYDDFGQLKFVIPPMGVKDILATASPIGGQATSAQIRMQSLSAATQYTAGMTAVQMQVNTNLGEDEGGGVSGGALAFMAGAVHSVVVQDALSGRLQTFVAGGNTTQGTLLECRWKVGAAGSVQSFRATRMDFQQGIVFAGLSGLGLTKGQTYSLFIELRTLSDEAGGMQSTGWSAAINMLYDFNVPANWNITQTLKDKWVTEFFYDELGRLIEKKIPEAAPLYTVYDALGRVALSQDGKLRENDQWMFAKWDDQGRPIITGIYTDHLHTTRASMQAFVNNGGTETTYQPITAHLEVEALGYNTTDANFSSLWNFFYVTPLIYTKPGDVASASVQVAHGMRADPLDQTPLCSYSLGMEYRISVNGVWPDTWTTISGNTATITLSGNQDAIAVRQRTLTINGGAGCQSGKVFITMDVTAQQPVYDLSSVAFYEKRTPQNYETQHGYTNNAFPNLQQCEVWSVAYFDDYDFNNDGTPDSVYKPDSEYTSSVNYKGPFYSLRGKVTGTKVRILGGMGLPGVNNTGAGGAPNIRMESGNIIIDGEFDSGASSELTLDPQNPGTIHMTHWLASVSFYDEFEQVIQTQSNNALGGSDISYSDYDFSGKVQNTKTVHCTPVTSVTVKKRYTYDHIGRVVHMYQQNTLDSQIGPDVLLAQNRYSTLGTLIEKSLHSTNSGSTFLQTVNYAYNIRGWLTKINDPANLGPDLFGMELKYESTDAAIAGNAQYNGNISQQIWSTSTTARHAYGYTYDQINQLSIAEYEKYNGLWNQDAGKFNEQATYDLNGNILSFVRGGATAWSSGQPSGYGTMDNLTYKYKGNQLMSVGDVIPAISGNNKYDFADNGSTIVYDVANPVATSEYSYDVNGNMTQDKNKGITSIEYNYLNLPTKVTFTGNRVISWAYTASGAKLSKTVRDNGTVVKTTDYVSGFVYENNTLSFFFTSQGRVKKTQTGSLQYEYDLKDHLGNTRVSFTDENIDGLVEVLMECHYYPFGMRVEGLGLASDNKYMFNGKEIEDDFGLNLLDFGWRRYDVQLGRWIAGDPLDQYHTPYGYTGNNPINQIDPDGAFSISDHMKMSFLSHWNPSKDLLGFIKGSFEAIVTLGIDVFGFDEADFHLDGKKNYNEIMEIVDAAGGWSKLRDHTIQDFYAHSNYAELYINFVGKEKFIANGGILPTIVEVQSNSAFVGVLRDNLRTTNFNLTFFDLTSDFQLKFRPRKKNGSDPFDHYLGTIFRAKDDKEHEYYRYAKDAAYRHTVYKRTQSK